jgi:serine protease Do
MKKVIIGGAAMVMLIVVGLMWVPVVSAQRPIAPIAQRQFDGLVLEGPGSSIGVSVRDLSADDASRAKVQQSDGVYIDTVREGTPAARAGLKTGDIVVDFDGERPRSTRHFTRLVRETAPGRSVKMTIVRDGSRQTLDITPEARNGFASGPLASADGVLRGFPRDFQFNFDGNRFNLWDGPFGSSARLGVVVTPLSEQLASYFGVKDGVLVSEVQASTPAATAGLKAGDVITSVNGHAVMDAQDVVNEIRDVQAGGSIELKVTRDRKDVTMKATFPERRRLTATAGRPI